MRYGFRPPKKSGLMDSFKSEQPVHCVREIAHERIKPNVISFIRLILPKPLFFRKRWKWQKTVHRAIMGHLKRIRHVWRQQKARYK